VYNDIVIHNNRFLANSLFVQLAHVGVMPRRLLYC